MGGHGGSVYAMGHMLAGTGEEEGRVDGWKNKEEKRDIISRRLGGGVLVDQEGSGSVSDPVSQSTRQWAKPFRRYQRRWTTALLLGGQGGDEMGRVDIL